MNGACLDLLVVVVVSVTVVKVILAEEAKTDQAEEIGLVSLRNMVAGVVGVVVLMLVLVFEGLKRRARRPAARPMPRRRPTRIERRTHGYEQRASHLPPIQSDKSDSDVEKMQSHFLFRFLDVFECSVKSLIFDRDLSFLFFFAID